MAPNTNADTREITIEVDEQTAEELESVALDYAVSRQTLLQRLCENAAERARH